MANLEEEEGGGGGGEEEGEEVFLCRRKNMVVCERMHSRAVTHPMILTEWKPDSMWSSDSPKSEVSLVYL